MSNQTVNGGLPPPLSADSIAILKGLQHYEVQVRAGALAGVVIIGVDPMGNVSATPAMPKNPQIMHILIGALAVMSARIARELDRMTVSAVPSPILKPGPGTHP